NAKHVLLTFVPPQIETITVTLAAHLAIGERMFQQAERSPLAVPTSYLPARQSLRPGSTIRILQAAQAADHRAPILAAQAADHRAPMAPRLEPTATKKTAICGSTCLEPRLSSAHISC